MTVLAHMIGYMRVFTGSDVTTNAGVIAGQ
jgi:hypothetical protein